MLKPHNHPVESHGRTALRNYIIQASTLLEITLSGLVLIGLLFSIVPLLKWMPGLLFDGSSLEVLLYAIARHMVVGHESAVENLLSVGAIALIFVVRKFFFVPAFGAHLPDGNPAPDLTPNQSGIPAQEFRQRLHDRIHAEDLDEEENAPEYEDVE